MLGKLAYEPDSWREMLIIGCMLALEEYYELELSYPQYTRQLTDSGCWMSEWADYDLEIGDFSPEYPSYPERMLVYLPQPLGLTKLKPTPGRGCAYYRRCFEEYLLAVSSSHADSWLEGNDPLHTYWMEPFLEFGVVELAHLDKENPGATKCATCS